MMLTNRRSRRILVAYFAISVCLLVVYLQSSKHLHVQRLVTGRLAPVHGTVEWMERGAEKLRANVTETVVNKSRPTAPGPTAPSTSLPCTQTDISRRPATVVLTTTNAGYLDIAENMLESIKRIRACPNITVIAEDERSYQQLTTRMKSQPGLHVQKSDFGYIAPDSIKKRTPRWHNFTKRRPHYILWFLDKGYDVLFADSDTVWFKDPLKDFQGDFDVAMVDERQFPNSVFCDGFAFYRRTNNTLNLVRQWIRLLATTEKGKSDQKTLNKLISKKIIRGLKVKSLSPSSYTDGLRYFRIKGWRNTHNKTTVMHVNYLLNHNAKVTKLKEFGWWYI